MLSLAKGAPYFSRAWEIRIRRRIRLRFGAYKYIIVGKPNNFWNMFARVSVFIRLARDRSRKWFVFVCIGVCLVLFVIQISHTCYMNVTIATTVIQVTGHSNG